MNTESAVPTPVQAPFATWQKISAHARRLLAELTVRRARRRLRLQETLVAPQPLESVAQVYDRSGSISRGSTDVGDVSWMVPTTGLRTATWVPGTSAHSPK